MRTFDIGGAGDCLFRVVFHQLYGEPSDTQLQEPDMTENVNKIITFASGEGNRPLGI